MADSVTRSLSRTSTACGSGRVGQRGRGSVVATRRISEASAKRFEQSTAAVRQGEIGCLRRDTQCFRSTPSSVSRSRFQLTMAAEVRRRSLCRRLAFGSQRVFTQGTPPLMASREALVDGSSSTRKQRGIGNQEDSMRTNQDNSFNGDCCRRRRDCALAGCARRRRRIRSPPRMRLLTGRSHESHESQPPVATGSNSGYRGN